MDTRRILLLALIICFALSIVESKRKSGGKKIKSNKKHKPTRYPSKIDDDQIGDLEQSIEELKKQVADLSSVAGNKVHFYFHGDQHDEAHDDDGHTHVDVHLHTHHDHDGDHHHHDNCGYPDGTAEAHCEMTNPEIKGCVHIVQEKNEDFANFYIEYEHLGSPNEDYPMHVHENGDLTHGCKSLGGHYNPQEQYKRKYSSKEKSDIPSDLGDLGVVQTDSDGVVDGVWKNNTHLSLFGGMSILGRSIIVHDTDGSKIGCCVIGRVSSEDESTKSSGHKH